MAGEVVSAPVPSGASRVFFGFRQPSRLVSLRYLSVFPLVRERDTNGNALPLTRYTVGYDALLMRYVLSWVPDRLMDVIQTYA